MGRPRSFDEGEVLEKAMLRFWRSGYDGTTLEDLERDTGLMRVSLYNAFGDKRDLFLACLRHYRASVVSPRLALLRDPSPGLEGIRRFFLRVLETPSGGEPGGCLMVNASVDETPLDPEVLQLVRQHFQVMEEFFTRALEGSRSCGELRADIEIPAAAAYLLAVVQGLAVVGRSAESGSRVRRAVQVVLDQLESWRATP